MKIKYNQQQAGPFELVGGSPQGSFLGQLCFSTGSLDNTEVLNIEEEDKYQYVDDLSLLELIFLTDILMEYDFRTHVASDIGIDQRFVPPSLTKTQIFNEGISLWSEQNITRLNIDKSKYIIHTRMREDIATRFTLKNALIERQSEVKILGV